MNLKTHTAYSQVNLSDNNVFEILFYDLQGKVVFEFLGAGRNPQDVQTRVTDIISKNQGDFIRKEAS